jgi:hypothetical protein
MVALVHAVAGATTLTTRRTAGCTAIPAAVVGTVVLAAATRSVTTAAAATADFAPLFVNGRLFALDCIVQNVALGVKVGLVIAESCLSWTYPALRGP